MSETAQIQPSEFRWDYLNSGIHLRHTLGTRGSSQEVSTVDRGSGVDGADSPPHAECVKHPKVTYSEVVRRANFIMCTFFYHSNKKFFCFVFVFCFLF